MSKGPYLAMDIGALDIKIAADGEVTPIPAPAGGPLAGLRAALATAGTGGTICVAVPDAWLTGDVSGATLQEQVRHECEDLAGTGPVIWAGQLAAVSALAATLHGPARYLVCDVGGTGVRAGMFGVSEGTVRIEAIHAEDGGGWRDFDAAVRATPLGAGLPADWYKQAEKGQSRASRVFDHAAEVPEEALDNWVYRIDEISLTARQVIGWFGPTLQRLHAALTAVLGAARPDRVVLTGGLGWLPLALRGIAESTGAEAEVLKPDAPAHGALLFARGEARLAQPAGCEPVSLPMHRIRDGLLEGVSVTLPWTEPFATIPGGALTVDDREELDLTVAGQARVARLRGLAPGRYRIGLRPAWPGPGVLVVRPVTGDSVHVVPLAAVVAR
jgi:hypothetical protein